MPPANKWRVPSPIATAFEAASLSTCRLSFTIVLTLIFVSTGLGAAEKEAEEFRAARSVHLHYPAPEAVLFYNEVVVEKSVNGSYFMACGWNTGYFGIQQLGGTDDKVVLFSVWDPAKGDDPSAVKAEDRVEVLYQGEGVRIKRFGGEGTGGQCMWRHNWPIAETNQFIVQAKAEDHRTSYTAWFRSPALADWKKLATFRVPHGAGSPRRDAAEAQGGLRGCYSFIEDFRRDKKSVNELRRARFGNGWVKDRAGAWAPLEKARFTASNAEWESKENIDAGTANSWFFLATGGDVKMTRKIGEVLGCTVSSPPPAALPHFGEDSRTP